MLQLAVEAGRQKMDLFDRAVYTSSSGFSGPPWMVWRGLNMDEIMLSYIQSICISLELCRLVDIYPEKRMEFCHRGKTNMNININSQQ